MLRIRRRDSDENVRWYVAVDDGTAARILGSRTDPLAAAQGATVRALVTPSLAFANLDVVAPEPERPSVPEADEEYGGATLLLPSHPRLPDAANVSAALGELLKPS